MSTLGQRVKVPTAGGDTFGAYVVRPETPNGRALVLLHTMFGINDRFRGFCREYAEHGYTVIAPHLFWRFTDSVEMEHTPESYQKGHDYVERLDMAQGVGDVAASICYLRERDRVAKVGVIGYCMGGTVAIAAAAGAVADVVVSYYPLKIKERMDDYRSITTPTVIHIGSQDPYAPPEAVSTLQDACRGRPEVELYVYPGAEHGFANRRVRTDANEAAADLAGSRTLTSLRRTLGA